MQTSRMMATPVPSPSAHVQTDRFARRLRRFIEPFWVVPALWSVAAVLLGLALPRLDKSLKLGSSFVFDAGVESARVVLSTTAGAMISVTGVVFSITVVVLQLASSQFSPRVLKTFLDDRLTQHTLGMFAASFLYALTVLRTLSDEMDTAPQIAVTTSFVIVLGAISMFLLFIHHITQSIAVSTIIGKVGDRSRALLERSVERRGNLPATVPELPHARDQAVVVGWASGYINHLDSLTLRSIAEKHDVRIEVLYPLGTFVPEGAPLAMVVGNGLGDQDWSASITPGIGLAKERTMEQDLTYGLRRLVDIAERALSPGVNDPTTAVQTLDELHDIMRRMAQLDCVYGVHMDDAQTPRVLTSEWSFGQYLSLAVDEIAHWGASSLQIPARLDQMLSDLEAAALEEHREAIRAKAHEVKAVSATQSRDA